MPDEPEVTRRAVVTGSGMLAASAALAACSTYGDQAPRSPQPGSGDAPGGGSGAASGVGQRLGATSAIPVGGGTVFAGQEVVVTQPTRGTFKAFSITCPHQGCSVNSVANGTINCPCHGSRFAIADGSVRQGPARQGLDERQVTVSGGQLVLGS